MILHFFEIQTTMVIFFGDGEVGGWGGGRVLRGLGVRVIRGSQFYDEKSVLLGVRGKPKKTPS